LKLHSLILSARVASTEKRSRRSGWQSPAKDDFDGAGFPIGPDRDEFPGADDGHAYQLLEQRTAKLIEPRSIPLTSPVTVARFC
jgi:hypothetical protein